MYYLFDSFFICDLELDDKEDNEPLHKMIDGNDKVEEPKEFMMFDSLKEVEDYYRNMVSKLVLVW